MSICTSSAARADTQADSQPSLSNQAKALAYIRRGETAANERNWRQAAAEFQQAARLDPGNAIASSDLGVALARCGDLAAAAQAEGLAVALDPRFVSAYLELGFVLYKLEDWTGAEAAARKALELDPANAIATRNLERILHAKAPASESTPPVPATPARPPELESVTTSSVPSIWLRFSVISKASQSGIMSGTSHTILSQDSAAHHPPIASPRPTGQPTTPTTAPSTASAQPSAICLTTAMAHPTITAPTIMAIAQPTAADQITATEQPATTAPTMATAQPTATGGTTVTLQQTGSRYQVANHPGPSPSNSLPVNTGVITLACIEILLLVPLVAKRATSREHPASRQAVFPLPEQEARNSHKSAQEANAADDACDHPASQAEKCAAAGVAAAEELIAYKQWQASMRDSF